MLNNVIRNAILAEVHRAIHEAASSCVAALENPNITYPPNEELTPAERSALAALFLSAEARSGMQKLLADTASYPLFHLFALMDGVGDPVDFPGEWTGLSLSVKEDDEPMLHDDFCESYWDFAESRTQ